ncbi:MAG: peptidylprolyl isomerase [Cycloclasticus sp.]|nr:peptidylprolyl isomerase [Cycloclasticus sp.]MBG96638.1 peptidylprolyl isomerase [Cycloclasticus sp.]HAI95985.1 peptidylprolyl isomerase [Methylococcaceae bacterium]|tara:strand:+ start:1942 stop:3240 length:1299 start_codon:yes stop_codon:yes gene_type:complete
MKRFKQQCLVHAFIFFTLGSLNALAQTPVNRIVAIVDKGVILQNQLDEQVQQTYQRLPPEQRASISKSDIEKRVLDRMIITELQLQIARRSAIKISDAEVEDSISRIAAANKLSPEEFLSVLEKDGVSLSSFKNTIRDQMLVRRVQSSYVHHEVKISEQEVDSFLNLLEQNEGAQSTEYHLGHILIATPENASPQQIATARKKADAIINSLKRGENFSTLSIANSDASNALEGGDLGWMKLAQMPTLLTPFVEKMAVNEFSEPIESPSGFHIIKLYETRGQQKVMVTKTHVRHILLKINALISDQIAQERLLNLKQRLENGEDFGALARANSEDRGSAIKGGDLGWVQPGALVPAFETAMDKLAINELSDPVQTQFGWHLIQVLGREEQDNTQLMREAQARSQLQKRKADAAIEAWLTKLRDEAYVEYRLED